MLKVTRKIGRNRGKPRLWLEGKIVSAAGFKPGDRFDLVAGNLTLSIFANPDGKRKISGKGEKPIIDISGGSVAPVDRFETVTVTADCDFRGGAIIVHPEIKNEETKK